MMAQDDESVARPTANGGKSEEDLVTYFPAAGTASTTEKLQLTIDLPENVERHLEPSAWHALKAVGERFLLRVLQEANQVAVDESKDALPTIRPEHVLQAQSLAVRRLRSRKGRSAKVLHFLRDIFIAALGGAAGLASIPILAPASPCCRRLDCTSVLFGRSQNSALRGSLGVARLRSLVSSFRF
jgi:hypothetical protein